MQNIVTGTFSSLDIFIDAYAICVYLLYTIKWIEIKGNQSNTMLNNIVRVNFKSVHNMKSYYIILSYVDLVMHKEASPSDFSE